MRYTAKPGRFFRFWAGGPETRKFFVVHQWARKSRVDYWKGSHKVKLPVLRPHLDDDKAKEALLENTIEPLLEAGCKAEEFDFPDGGMYVMTNYRSGIYLTFTVL